MNGRGFSLIELLVAVSLLGGGLLAVARLEVAVIQRNASAFDTQLATSIVQTLIERMRANTVGVDQGDYGNGSRPSVAGPDCARGTCSPAERASWDLHQAWNSLGSPVSTTQGFRGLSSPNLVVECLDDPCAAGSRRRVAVTWSAVPDGSRHLELVMTP